MSWISWSFALSVLAVACSALSLVLVGRRSPTAFAQQARKIAADTLARWESEVKLFEATRERWSQEFAGIVDRCDELLDRTESKRRRFAAAESKANGGHVQVEGDPYAGMSRAQVIETARRRTLG